MELALAAIAPTTLKSVDMMVEIALNTMNNIQIVNLLNRGRLETEFVILMEVRHVDGTVEIVGAPLLRRQ